jgi:outer membrane protein assembly factor BamB
MCPLGDGGLPQIRTGMVAAVAGGRTLVFFGDASGQVYALDASTGRPAWQLRVDSHPAAMVTGTPAYHDAPVRSGRVLRGSQFRVARLRLLHFSRQRTRH